MELSGGVGWFGEAIEESQRVADDGLGTIAMEAKQTGAGK